MDNNHFISNQYFFNFDKILQNKIFGWSYLLLAKKCKKKIVSENIAAFAGVDLGRSESFSPSKKTYFATWLHWSHLHWFAGLRSNDF